METKTLIISGALVGAAAGAALGLFLASSSEETKEKLINGAKKLVGTIKEKAFETATGAHTNVEDR